MEVALDVVRTRLVVRDVADLVVDVPLLAGDAFRTAAVARGVVEADPLKVSLNGEYTRLLVVLRLALVM